MCARASSLAQIKRLPVDQLKIDRSFVVDLPHDAADTAIVRSTIELAHNLSLRVVAEGVETEEALVWLAAQGCDEAQGYYIAHAMAEELFTAWARERLRVGAGPVALRAVPSKPAGAA